MLALQTVENHHIVDPIDKFRSEVIAHRSQHSIFHRLVIALGGLLLNHIDDTVLKMVAQLLRKSIRKTDFMARIGGEEFVMLLPNTSLREGIKFANTVRENIAKSGFNYKGNAVSITASCGLSCILPGDTIEALYERADAALYRAKHQGRNRCIADAPGSAAA